MSKVFSNRLARGVITLLAVSLPASATIFTVSNTTDTTNPGSLRWALGQAQNPVGAPHVIAFAISPPCSPSPCAAMIQVNSLLPVITQPLLIDGTTQTNTNPLQLGTGGTVGLDNIAIPKVNAPDVEIYKGTGAVSVGLDIGAGDVTIRGLAIYGFGQTANTSVQSSAHGNITIAPPTGNVSNVSIVGNVIGMTATGAIPPQPGASAGIHVFGTGTPNVFNGIIDGNIIAHNRGVGVRLANTAAKWIVTRNEIHHNGQTGAVGGLDGISVDSFPSNTNGAPHDILDNWIYENDGSAVDSWLTAGGLTVRNNTIYGNGVGPAGNAPRETFALRFNGAGAGNIGNKVERNRVFANYGGGIAVAGVSAVEVLQNSFSNNGTIPGRLGEPPSGGLGIDLFNSGNGAVGVPPFYDLNDVNDVDTGGNDLLNTPIVESAKIEGGDLVLTGYAQPGAKVEFYVANADPSGFGEGETPFVSLIEGSPADTDISVGIYSGILNGIDQGSDTANRYVFRVPLPGGVTVASKITALSHVFGKTSEFSAIAPVTLATLSTDLAVEDLSLSMNPTRLGSPEYSYFVAIKNSGPNEATGLTMTLSIPHMVSMNSFLAPSWSCTQVTTTITCTRASMPSGLTSILEIRATSFLQGSFSVNANVAHAGVETFPSNNFRMVTQAVVSDSADLQLAASVFPAVPSAGAAVTYELTVTNQGPDPATALYASLNLPSGSTYQSFMGINWSCTGGGNSVNCTRPGSLGFPSQTLLTVVASAPTVVGAGYTYNLAVGAATSDGFPSNNTASGVFSVGAGADIELGSIANPNPVGTGQEIVFSVFVTNKGGAPAIDPYFDVFFSPGVVYKSFAGPSGWSCGPSEGSISCTAATQATTPPTQVNIYATAPFDPGIASISVNGGAQNDTTPANNTTTAMTAVVAIADLALGSVSALPNVPIPGQEMTVSIPILNIGPQPAADAILVLQMPPSFQYVSVESPGWICGVSSFQVTCTATVIPFGTGVLALKLKPTTFGLFSLSASISSATLDPVAANNVSTLDDGLVHECASPGDCLGKPICEMGGRATINRCRECLSNPDCPVDRPVCDVLTKVCTVSICKSDADCSGAQGRCDIPVGKCVECLTNTHCNSGFVCAGQRCEKCDPRDPGSTCAPDKGGSACVFSQAEQYECGCVTDAFCGPSNSGRVCTASKSCIEGCRGTGGNGCASGFTCTSTTNAIGACQRVAPTDAGVDGSVSPSDAGITDGSTLPGLPDGSVILSDGGVLLPDGAVVALPEAGTPGNPNTRPSPFDDAGYDSKSTNTPVAVDCTLRTGGPSSGSSAAFYGMLVTAALVVARRRSKQV